MAKGSARRPVWVSMTGDSEAGWAHRRRGTARTGRGHKPVASLRKTGDIGCLERMAG